MRSDIREGETFPDYELADVDPAGGGPCRSSEGANTMVLHLSHHSFDPKKHQFRGQLVDLYLPVVRNVYTRFEHSSRPTISSNINELRDIAGRHVAVPVRSRSGRSRRIWTSKSSRMSRTIR